MIAPHRHRSAGSARAGFSLIEVLVAVAVFAILSTFAFAGLMNVLDNRERLNVERERWRALALAFAQMEDDLSHARQRSVRDDIGFQEPAFIGRPADPRPMGEPMLVFTRDGAYVQGDGPVSDMRRVAYAQSENKLVRRVWSALDRPPASTTRETVLASGIDNLTVRIFVPGGGLSDTWPTGGTGVQDIPLGIEIAFDIAGVGRITRTFAVGR